MLSGIGLAALLIADALQWLPQIWYFRLPLFLLPYVPVAWEVWRRAARNLLHGQWLDENFLMAIATVGALVIGEYPEAVFVMLFYQVGELFQSIAVGRSRRSIAALMEIRPDEARVERAGEAVTLLPEEVLVGDILIVRPGERIPLDSIVLEGESDLDTRALTGESLPQSVKSGDAVISGCINISGLLRLRVTKTFGESTVSKILELVEHSAMAKSRAESAVTKFARWYTPTVVVGAILLAVIPSLVSGDWQRWLHTALIFLVVSCPCALVISVPLSYFGGLGCASRHGILMKGSNYLEALATVDTVAFDKTGTLTEGRFSLSRVCTMEDVSEECLLALAAAAERHSNHPIALSLQEAAKGMDGGFSVEDVTELSGKGVRAHVDGQEVLVGNRAWMLEVGFSVPDVQDLGTVVFVASAERLLGYLVISDTVKESAADAIAALRKCGVRRTVMLSGDRRAMAEAVARELHLDEYRGELLPADKVRAVEELLEETRGSLLYVGDGINDAPVLARADVGIAMGAMGSDAAIEAADVVLMEDRPEKIATAMRIARFTKRIVKQNVLFALSVKAIFLLLGIFGMTNLWAATFADVGVAVIAILNAMRTLQYR